MDFKKVTVVIGKHSSAYNCNRDFLEGILGAKVPVFYFLESSFYLLTFNPRVSRLKISDRITIFNVINKIGNGYFTAFN